VKVVNQSKMETFQFTKENEKKAKDYIKRYPKGREESAIMPLLWLAQKQSGGWLPQFVLEYVAKYLKIPNIKVLEVASFYSMYNLEPVGENFIQICRTTPCWLRGAENLSNACKKYLGVALGEVTGDKKFSVVEVECLGACANAPMVQINDDYYEDLTEASLIALVEKIRKGEKVTPGSQTGRCGSEPQKMPVLQKKNGEK